jgi:hypothetical protein
MSGTKEKQASLKSKGLSDPLNFYKLHRPDVPWFTQTLPEASLPLYKVPQNVSCLGPMSLYLGDAEEQDPDMAKWLARGPTVLVNLGSGFTWMEQKATVMASALAEMLQQLPDFQVLWKLRKYADDALENVGSPGGEPYDDTFAKPLQPFVEQGRVKIVSWLSADPTALLKTGHIVASVHHGGAGCYHEAIE